MSESSKPKSRSDAVAAPVKSPAASNEWSAGKSKNDGGEKATAVASEVAAQTPCDLVAGGGRPPWHFSSVTDDRSTVDVYRCGPPACAPHGCSKPEQLYACDRQAARTLAQYVSPEERAKVAAWLDALDGMTLDEDELSERALYLTCLVMLLRAGQLVPPFTRAPPPCRPLRPLRDVVSRNLYKRVQVECRKRRVYQPAEYHQPDRGVAQRPSEFFDQMPSPESGIFCYGAAFSFM